MGRIIVEIRRYQRQCNSEDADNEVGTYLKERLSPEDFLFWQTLRWSLDGPAEGQKDTDGYSIQDRDAFEQLFGCYKRAGYELIATLFQPGKEAFSWNCFLKTPEAPMLG